MWLLVLIIYSCIGFIEIHAILKEKQYKEFILYSIVLSLALFLNILIVKNIDVPSPAKFIEKTITTIIKIN